MSAVKRAPPADIEQQLRMDENDVPYVYQDHLGFWTIGVGFMVDRRRGGKLPPKVRDYWLQEILNDRRAALRAALPWFDRLDQARQGVLLNMSYQMGVIGLLTFKATLAATQGGRYDEAADSMLKSLWATQTPERAGRLAEQMRTGTWQ